MALKLLQTLDYSGGISPFIRSVGTTCLPSSQKHSVAGSLLPGLRYALTQDFFVIPTNLPPKSLPKKLWISMRPWHLRCPMAQTHFMTSVSQYDHASLTQ